MGNQGRRRFTHGMKSRLLRASQVRMILQSVGTSLLPEIQRDYKDALEYVLGPKDRAGTRVSVSGGDDYSDPTADTALDQKGNIEELKRIGKKIESLEKDARTISSRLKGLFDVGGSESRRTDGAIPSAEEEFQRLQAVKAQVKRALHEERRLLEKRLCEIDRNLENVSA